MESVFLRSGNYGSLQHLMTMEKSWKCWSNTKVPTKPWKLQGISNLDTPQGIEKKLAEKGIHAKVKIRSNPNGNLQRSAMVYPKECKAKEAFEIQNEMGSFIKVAPIQKDQVSILTSEVNRMKRIIKEQEEKIQLLMNKMEKFESIIPEHTYNNDEVYETDSMEHNKLEQVEIEEDEDMEDEKSIQSIKQSIQIIQSQSPEKLQHIKEVLAAFTPKQQVTQTTYATVTAKSSAQIPPDSPATIMKRAIQAPSTPKPKVAFTVGGINTKKRSIDRITVTPKNNEPQSTGHQPITSSNTLARRDRLEFSKITKTKI